MSNKTKEIYDIDRMSRLSSILNYQVGTATLFLLVFVSRLTIWLGIIAVILFLPYLLYVLFRERRYGWILTFVAGVLLLYTASLFIGMQLDGSFMKIILVAYFFLYCFTLKFSVSGWIKEYNWQLVLDEQKREKQQRLRDEMNMF